MGAYDDIINLPHHVSDRHPQMPIGDRAAQFSPFAALTGYDAEVKEAARLTGKKIDLCEDQQDILDRELRLLEDILPQQPEVSITYFRPDGRKEGGAYITIKGNLKHLERMEQCAVLVDGTIIPLENILQIRHSV